jgi:ABC-2 type transport system ATP-binding protein
MGDTGEAAVRLEGVSKRYGRIKALEDFTAHLDFGEIVGLLGPNGAGKSTAMRVMVGLVRATRGRVEVLGRPMPRAKSRVLRRVGAIIEEPAFYDHLSARLNLSFLADYHGRIPAGRVAEVLERMELSDRADDPVETYSVGMKGRLALAAALLPSPGLLLLDEPMAGFDPGAVRMVGDLLREEASERGAAVLVSSHMLSEVARLCDRVLVLRQGRLLGHGPTSRGESDWTELRVSEQERAAELLGMVSGVVEVRREQERLLVRAPEVARADLVDRLVAAGLRVDLVAPHKPSLEEFYFDLVGGGGDAARHTD